MNNKFIYIKIFKIKKRRQPKDVSLIKLCIEYMIYYVFVYGIHISTKYHIGCL